MAEQLGVEAAGNTDGDTGDLVRRARTAAGVSLRELARRIQVSAGTLSATENGKTPLTVDRLNQIAAALGVTTVDMLAARLPPTIDNAVTHAMGDGQIWRTFTPLRLDPALAAAINTFVATGYHGATMRIVAANARMSVSGVYHHYPSKQRLLVAILDLAMTELHWRIPAARDSSDDTVERLANMVEALALFHTHRRDLAFIGASEMRSLAQPDRSRITKRRNEVQHMLDDEIAAGIRTGEFTTPHPHDAGHAIATMCTSLPQWFRADGPVSREQIATEYAEFALDILCGHGRKEDSPSVVANSRRVRGSDIASSA